MAAQVTPQPHAQREVVRVSKQSTRAELEAGITALRAKQDRMPKAWVDRRAEVGDEIDELVDWWLEAKA
jgi:hypothetical protein